MKKKLLTAVALLMTVCTVLLAIPFSATAATTTSTWDGTASDTSWFTAPDDASDVGASAENPFIIDSAAKLKGISALCYGDGTTAVTNFTWQDAESAWQPCYLKLTVDVDLADKLWVSIGTNAAKNFRGVFDGDGHTISNLNTVDNGFAANNGLFGNVQPGAGKYKPEIKNLTVNGSKLRGHNASPVCAIALNVNFDNVTVLGNIEYSSATTMAFGPIVGKANGDTSISNCDASRANLKFSIAFGTSNAVTIGGIAGQHDSKAGSKVTIENCNAKIDVTAASVLKDNTKGANLYLGGIIGYCAQSEIEIRDCVADVKFDVTRNDGKASNTTVGGILGNVLNSSETECVTVKIYDCDVKADIKLNNKLTASAPNVGGIVGFSNNKAATQTSSCYVEGCSVTGKFDLTNVSNVGGIVSYAVGTNTIKNCYTDIDMTSDGETLSRMGGIIGSSVNALLVENCVSQGDITVTGETNNYMVGGIVGEGILGTDNKNTDRKILNSMYTGNVNVTASGTGNNMYAGGIAGKFMNGVIIDNTVMYGTVTANYAEASSHRTGIFVGGFGFNSANCNGKGDITNSYCAVPEKATVAPDANTNTEGTKLYAVGAYNVASITSLTLIAENEASELKLKGVQNSAKRDYTPAGAESPEKVFDVRFVAALGDSANANDKVLEDYKQVGYIITAVIGTRVVDFSVSDNSVYSFINAGTEKKNASDLGADYLVALSAENLPAEESILFFVTPKCIGTNGKTTFGTTQTIIFSNGAYVPSAK